MFKNIKVESVVEKKDNPVTSEYKDIGILNTQTLTIFRPNMLQQRVMGDYNLVAAGTPRGGTSILGMLMKLFNYEMGSNVHPETYEDLDLHMKDVDKWGELIDYKIKKTPNWSVKYPAATRHLNIFNRHCPKPVFIIIIRNPFSVTKSMIKHDTEYSNKVLDYYKGMEIALESYIKFNNDMKTINAPFIIIEHETAIANPELFINELIDALNIHTDHETISKAIKLISSPGYKRIEECNNNI